MSKKILSMILAAALMLTMAIPAAAAGSNEFSDTKGHWAESVISQWSKFEVVQGDGNGKFRPEASMTRGEFATAMVNLLGLTKKTNYNVFTDLKGDEWYAEPILKLHKAGILKGDESKRSNPNARISREESFVMVGRALGITPKAGASLSGYDDADSVSNWAKPMMATLVEEGYIKGVTASTLRPGTNINRASVMQVLSNTVTTYVTEPGTYTAPDKGFVVVKATEGKVTLQGGADGVIIGQSSQGTTVNLDGATISGDVRVDAPNVTVNVKDSKVDGTVEVTSLASGATLDVAAGSTVENVATGADNVAVKGKGEVKNVEVTGGDKVEVATPGTVVKVDEDAKDSTVTAGGETVKPGESGTTAGTPDGFVEPEPTPDTPSGGGTVTPSVKSSALKISAGKDVPNWPGCPALKAMTLDYSAVSGTTVTPAGALVKAAGFTGFSDEVKEQSGYYAMLEIAPNTGDLAAIRAAEGTVLTVKGKKTKTFDKSIFATDDTLGLLLQVAEESGTAQDFTITADWDGPDGAKYKETAYTVKFSDSGVKLIAETSIGTAGVQCDAGTTTGTPTVTQDPQTKNLEIALSGTTIKYDAAAQTNRFTFTLTPPAGITEPVTFQVNGADTAWDNGKVSIDFTDGNKSTPQVVTLAWVADYEQIIKVDASMATLEPKPVAPAVSSTAKLSVSTSNDLHGKKASELMEGVQLGEPVSGTGSVTYTPTGKLLYVSGYTGFNESVPTEQKGYYLAFHIQKPETGLTAPADTTPVLEFYGINADPGQVKKTFTYADLKNDDFFMVARVEDNSKTIQFKLDWDGTGSAYSATTYKLVLSGLTFDTAGMKLLKRADSNEITFQKEATTPASPYALMHVAYTRLQDLDEVEVEATIPVEGSGAKTVWHEHYLNRAAGENAKFTWSMRDLSDGADENGYTPTGSAAESYEQNNRYLIPAGTEITITISAKKAGYPNDQITVTHTVTAENIHQAWFGGWPGNGKLTTEDDVFSAVNALGEATYDYSALNPSADTDSVGMIVSPALAGATVHVAMNRETRKISVDLSGTIESGIPAGSPFAEDFIEGQFDPHTASVGYTAVNLIGAQAKNSTIVQTNHALSLYPKENWITSEITQEGSNAPVKTKRYTSVGDYDFLILDNKQPITIQVTPDGGSGTVEYTIGTSGLTINDPTDLASNGTALKHSTYNPTGLTMLATDKTTGENGIDYQTIYVSGNVAFGLEGADTAIEEDFNGNHNLNNGGAKYSYVTLKQIGSANCTIVQENEALKFYAEYESTGVKSKDYTALQDYDLLLKEGQNARITVTDKTASGHQTVYYIVNGLTIAEPTP